MKKNGFTLIEIIGAIIILGIIAIIAFATYSSSIKDFRDIYYQKEVKTIEKSGKEFFNDNRNYRPTKILHAQEVKINTLETQNYLNGVVDYNGDSCSNNSYILVIKEDTDIYSYHACLICDKDGYDNTSDNIYCDRSWLDPTKVTYGIGEVETAYVYKGITKDELKDELELPIAYVRKDNEGNILASRRGTKEGNETMFPINLEVVNTDVVGTYKVTYQYGEDTKIRDIVVYENQSPTITYKKAQKVANSVTGETKIETTTYNSGEWAQNVIVNLNSNTYTDPGLRTSRFQWNVDGKWQDFCESDPCEVKIERELNQTVQFRLVDSNGHISLLTDQITMRIDNTAPRCGVRIPTTIGENDWYNTDVVVEFSEKVDQKKSDDNSLVSGIKRYNIQKTTDNLVREATINSIVHNQDTASVTYNGYVEDQAENFATCSVTFRRDDTDPTCEHDGDSTSYVKGSRTITWGCDDPKSNNVNSECNPSYSGGNRTYSETKVTDTISAYTIKDNAGNIVNCPSRTANVYVDNTAPVCGTVSYESSTISSVTATVGCTDGNSGCKENPFKKTGQTTSGKMRIEDNVGNYVDCDYTVYTERQKRTRSCSFCGTHNCNPHNCNPHDCNPYSCNAHDCNCDTCQGECNSWSSYSNSSCYGSSTACSNGCRGSCNEVGGNCKVQCTWTTYNCNGYNTYSCYCDTCYSTCYETCYDTCYDQCNNDCSTNSYSCQTWGGWSNWADSSCSPASSNASQTECREVYRAR